MKTKFIFLFCYIYITSFSQPSNSTFPRDFSIFSEKSLHTLQSDFHTSIKPYLLQNADSIITNKDGDWLQRKWNDEHFLQVEKKDYSFGSLRWEFKNNIYRYIRHYKGPLLHIRDKEKVKIVL